MWINSSLEIKCSTSLENLSGLSLKRRFLGDEQILYLNFDKGVVTKNTTVDKFQNRISITKEQLDPGARYKFKLQLSLLGLEDTDLYYCSWAYIDEQYNNVNLESNGTVIIVRGERECAAYSHQTNCNVTRLFFKHFELPCRWNARCKEPWLKMSDLFPHRGQTHGRMQQPHCGSDPNLPEHRGVYRRISDVHRPDDCEVQEGTCDLDRMRVWNCVQISQTIFRPPNSSRRTSRLSEVTPLPCLRDPRDPPNLTSLGTSTRSSSSRPSITAPTWWRPHKTTASLATCDAKRRCKLMIKSNICSKGILKALWLEIVSGTGWLCAVPFTSLTSNLPFLSAEMCLSYHILDEARVYRCVWKSEVCLWWKIAKLAVSISACCAAFLDPLRFRMYFRLSRKYFCPLYIMCTFACFNKCNKWKMFKIMHLSRRLLESMLFKFHHTSRLWSGLL